MQFRKLFVAYKNKLNHVFIFSVTTKFGEIGIKKPSSVSDRTLPRLTIFSFIYRAQSTVDEEDDEAEWERFQRKLNKYVKLKIFNFYIF